MDGTVVPCAAAGSLMLGARHQRCPRLRAMRGRFGDRTYGRYGFADAFHPNDGWVNPDVIGIDLGITLLSAENLRTGRIWQLVHAQPGDPRGDGKGRSHPRFARTRSGPSATTSAVTGPVAGSKRISTASAPAGLKTRPPW